MITARAPPTDTYDTHIVETHSYRLEKLEDQQIVKAETATWLVFASMRKSNILLTKMLTCASPRPYCMMIWNSTEKNHRERMESFKKAVHVQKQPPPCCTYIHKFIAEAHTRYTLFHINAPQDLLFSFSSFNGEQARAIHDDYIREKDCQKLDAKRRWGSLGEEQQCQGKRTVQDIQCCHGLHIFEHTSVPCVLESQVVGCPLPIPCSHLLEHTCRGKVNTASVLHLWLR